MSETLSLYSDEGITLSINQCYSQIVSVESINKPTHLKETQQHPQWRTEEKTCRTGLLITEEETEHDEGQWKQLPHAARQ